MINTQSPFLIARFVFFALLFNLSILVLIFASWNVYATITAGLSVPATSVFLVFDSCIALCLIVFGLVELVVPWAKTSHILFECAWSAILALFQTGASISLTINSSGVICRENSDYGVCASSSLLVPTTWLSTLIILTHFFALFITTVAHTHVCPGIWSKTVYSVAWFPQPETRSPSQDNKLSEDSTDTWTQYLKDMEVSSRKGRSSTADCEKAPWAHTANIRRGLDDPFKRKTPSSVAQSYPSIIDIRRGVDDPFKSRAASSAQSSPSTSSSSLPIAPLKAQDKGTPGSRFIEKFRESQLISRPGSRSLSPAHLTKPVTPFPPTVDNHDLPIPLPRLSEWIRADAIKGINVHTVPYSP